MILATLGMSALIFFAGGFTSSKNGFKRKISKTSLRVVKAIKKPVDFTGISAITNDCIFFHTSTPGKLVITDHYLSNRRSVSIQYSSGEKTASLFYTLIDSPHVYLLAGNNGTIAHAMFNDKNFYNYSFKLPVFTRAVFIPPLTFIIRGCDTFSLRPDQIFMKINTASGTIQRENNISVKTGDAGITTDGLLHYDSSSHLLTYTFFYNNNFTCFDTNLHIVYKAHTIDTTNTYQVRTGSIGTTNEKIYTNTAPSRIVNWESDVDNGRLYINSRMKADNESIHFFNNNSVIDVYDIATGAYQESFYVPYYKGEKMESFKVINNELVALYKSYIIAYAGQL